MFCPIHKNAAYLDTGYQEGYEQGIVFNKEPTEILVHSYIFTYKFTSDYDKVYCVAFQGSNADPVYSGDSIFTEIDNKEFSQWVGIYKIENVSANDTLRCYGYGTIFK